MPVGGEMYNIRKQRWADLMLFRYTILIVGIAQSIDIKLGTNCYYYFPSPTCLLYIPSLYKPKELLYDRDGPDFMNLSPDFKFRYDFPYPRGGYSWRSAISIK